MMRKIFLVLAIICLIGGVCWLFFRQECRECKNPNLVVGIAAGYAPFVSINPAGEYEGFDIEVAQKLAEQLGRNLELRDLGSMSSLFTALQQGQLDLIMWGVSITTERMQKVAMVHYWGEKTTTYPLLFWEHIPGNLKSLKDLAGQLVAVEAGSSQQAVLDRYPEILQLSVEKVDDALLNLQFGKVAAILVEPAIGRKFKAHDARVKTLDITLDPADQVSGIGIVVRPGCTDLLEQVEAAVQTLKVNGIIARLAQKWEID